MQWWFADRNASVAAQHDVRDALNTEGQYWLSRLAARDASGLRPCKRTVVSIATIPSRISRLYNLVSSIRHQRLRPDAILIALPPFAPRLKQAYTVPDFLKDDPFVKLVHLPVDFGPLSKLAAAIHAESDPDTCILTCVWLGRTRTARRERTQRAPQRRPTHRRCTSSSRSSGSSVLSH